MGSLIVGWINYRTKSGKPPGKEGTTDRETPGMGNARVKRCTEGEGGERQTQAW